MSSTDQLPPERPLRLWPGVVIVVLQWLAWLALPFVFPEASAISVISGVAGGLLIAIWWMFLSRAPWLERVGALLLMVAGLFLVSRFVHESIANGMMGMMLSLYAIPVLSLVLVAWAMARGRFSTAMRLVSLVVVILLACASMTLVRTGGMTGTADSDLHWRWTKTPEETLLAEAGNEPAATRITAPGGKDDSTSTPVPRSAASGQPKSPASPGASPGQTNSLPDWPGFRGPNRDSTVRGTHILTNWSQSPPVEVWRRPVGPGWSSFAVQGNLCYTQEQRGEDEMVACYELTTGAPVWLHRDSVRFWESNAGAGPRGTPTLSNGRVYTLGATGLLNALDARTGSVLWSRNAASDTGSKTPNWGFAGSPLVLDDVVIVATAGVLAAYELNTGAPRWVGTNSAAGYSSPHSATIRGVPQILLINGNGILSVTPADGKTLWSHSWPGDGIVQPAVLDNGDVLVGSGSGLTKAVGLRRLAITNAAAGWSVEERWTSNGLKPYYNDFVVHEGHAYGLDGTFLACVDLADGRRKWKGGRYGYGQLLLLRDQQLLLVLSEKGELALVKAVTDDYSELARLQAVKGKTWNHPVLVRDILLVRNAQEMAAFRLPTAAPANLE